MNSEILDKLNEETEAKLLAAKTPEEVFELAKKEGYKLSPEELEAISGGDAWLSCNYC